MQLSNPRRERFAHLIAAGRSAASAYAEAGYKPSRQAGSRLRQDVDVVRRVDELVARAIEKEDISTSQALEKAGITKLQIIRELAILGFARMDAFVVVAEHGQPFLDLNNTPREKFAAIQSITVKEYYDEKREQTVRETKFTLHDKKGALIDLARMHGMTNDKLNAAPTLIQINLNEADLRA